MITTDVVTPAATTAVAPPRDARNGLQALSALGVPDSSITALLVTAATLTVLPHIAGRSFGTFTVPDVLTPGVFWMLTLAMPVLWVVLLGSIRFADSKGRNRALAIAAALVAVSGMAGFGSSTVSASEERRLVIDPGSEQVITFELPGVSRATQRLDVTLVGLQGTQPGVRIGAGVHVAVCGAAVEKCEGEQIGVNRTIVKKFERGGVRIAVFNFANNPIPVEVTLRLDYLRRRFM